MCLSHILLGQKRIQGTSKHVLHNWSIVSSFQHDTHALAFGFRIRIFLIHHSNVSLATEEDERVERLLVGDLVGFAAFGCNSLTRGDAKGDRFGEIFRRELDEDRVRVSVDDLGTILCFNHMLRDTQGFAAGGGGGGCDAKFSDWGCTRATLPVNRVCNDLVSKLKTVKDGPLGFIVLIPILHLLLELFSFLQQDVQRFRQNPECHGVLCRLDERTDCFAVDNPLLILGVILNLLQHIPLLVECGDFRSRESIVEDLVSIHVESTLTHECVRTEIVTNHIGRIQGVEIQHRDGLVQIHPNLGWKHNRTLVPCIVIDRVLDT